MIDQLIANRYRILKRIFTNEGYAQLYIAEDTALPSHPLCVIEHFKPADLEHSILNTDQWLKTKLAALQTLSSHHQIPDLLDFCWEDDELFIVNQFVEGQALKMAVSPEDPWPEAQVITVLGELLDILAFAHQQGMMHGNIKLDSIVRRQSDYKLALVGFSLAMQIQAQAGIQKRKILDASLATVSKFESTGDRQLDPLYTHDIYSLGIVGIQTLTGLSYEEIDRLERDLATGAICWVEHAEVSPDLVDVLNTMVKPRPADRYQSVTEALQAIKQLRGFNLPALPTPAFLTIEAPTRSASQSMFGQLLTSDQLVQIDSLAPGQAIPPTARQRAEKLRSQQVRKIHPLKLAALLIGLGVATTALVALATTIVRNPNPNWQNVFAQAKGQRSENNFLDCLSQAKTIPPDSRLYDDAQALIIQCQLEPAQKLAAVGQLPQAIAALLKISSDSPGYRQAQQLIGQWSDRLLTQATDQYRQGNLTSAIALAQTIPSTSPVSNQAQEAISLWQREWQANSANLALAKQALAEGNWQQAISLAGRLTLLGQPVPETSAYWQQQVSPIIKDARTAGATPSPSSGAKAQARLTSEPQSRATPEPQTRLTSEPQTSSSPTPPTSPTPTPEASAASGVSTSSPALASPTPQPSPAIAATAETTPSPAQVSP